MYQNNISHQIYEYVNTTYVYKFVNASESDYSTDFKVEHVYSYSRGLCYKFLFLRKVNIRSSMYQVLSPIQKNNRMNIFDANIIL